ncbi:cytochrome c oxidase assembly protein COX19 [Kwoniella dejecticola CBS 10117]|uniref:Cytochrome c oxidase assembly protein COX19 n=1 Tax=Kwoniella dejecticola CBS 10117 TaxID=1296121 RepID=A0A1A6ABR0_9TREE|nr:cytochrome c oxidase assembly protein COX19 [Kwoniella dejecticola CBS 10117]OBR87490.1 cytochrome c oxidase assembly protein COX19 [Kwoniella dejecticola CBS 10117]
MSFGRPGFADTFKVSPPQRGSFPLDHDGDCKDAMLSYLKCLKSNANDNGKCRLQSKKYLECRMDNGLMTRDDFQNLGLGDVVDPLLPKPEATTAPASTSAFVPNSNSSSSSTSAQTPPTNQERI